MKTKQIETDVFEDSEKKEFYKGKIFRDFKGKGLKWKIEQFFEDIKRAWQRAKNGYARCDTWDIDYWFNSIMPHMIDDMIKDLHSYPGRKGAEDYDKWVEILQTMKVYIRESNEETCSQKNEWEDSYELKSSCTVDEQGRNVWHSEALPKANWEKYLKREKEIDKYRRDCLDKGLELFKKWYWDMWD